MDAHFIALLREPAKLPELSKAEAVTRDAPYLRVVAVGRAALDECSINLGDWTSKSESVYSIRLPCREYDCNRTTHDALGAVFSLWGLLSFSCGLCFLPASFQLVGCSPVS